MIKRVIKFSVFVFSVFAFLGAEAASIPPVVVEVMKVEKINHGFTLSVPGSLEAFNGTKLSAETSGRVTEILFKPGVKVKKGDLLVRLNSESVEASLEKAKAQYKLAELNYQRNLQLYKQRYIDRSTLDSFKTAMESAQADIDLYQAELNKLLIRAPFDGKIGLRNVSLGDYVSPGVILTSLQMMNPIKVAFSVPEKYIRQIAVGDKVIVTASDFQGAYNGSIYAIDSSIDKNTRSIDVEAQIDNSSGILVPGAFVEINIISNQKKDVLVIPQNSVVYESTGVYVYKLNDHKVAKTLVTLGDELENNQVIVKEGLAEGDVIVTSGQSKIFDGAPVTLMSELQQMKNKVLSSSITKD